MKLLINLRLAIFGTLLVLASQSFAGDLKDTSGPKFPSDLLAGSIVFNEVLADDSYFSIDNCSTYLDTLYIDLMALDPNYFDVEKASHEYVEIINNLWLARLTLRNRLKEFSQSEPSKTKSNQLLSCVQSVRTALRATRYVEDYLAEAFSNVTPYKEGKDPKSINTLEGVSPELLQAPGRQVVKVRSGDVFMSRGNAFTSAAIARIGDVDAQFSHIALLYIKGEESGKEFSIEEIKNMDNALMLEAHIEIGTTIRPMRDYLLDGNAKVLQFRMSDPALAHRAATGSYDIITNKMKKSRKKYWWRSKNDVNHNVPYDFKMSLKNTDEVFCSEMASMGYATQGLKVPEFMTRIPKQNDLAQRLGIKQFQTFAPADMEVDTRFELLAEWRDLRKLENLRYKDAILTKVFQWMEINNYVFKQTKAQDIRSRFGKIIRSVDLGFKHSFPKNISVKTMNSIVVLDEIGTQFQSLLEKQDEIFKNESGGLLMPLSQMQQSLEAYRVEDLKAYYRNKDSEFHDIFRPEL